MRKLEKMMVNAINSKKNFSGGNIVVVFDANGFTVSLHGNTIYQKRGNNAFFTLAGWNTVTTRSRLNALGVGVSQKNWDPIYNGTVINSYNWYTV